MKMQKNKEVGKYNKSYVYIYPDDTAKHMTQTQAKTVQKKKKRKGLHEK